jgi:anionic cell wall polymer biosynthesis LytR-Cps2A-Psr (LCP) family protein
MSGEIALKYTRSRHGDSDFGRSRRQFEVLLAIKDELTSTKITPKSPIVRELLAEVSTNLDLNQIATLADFVGGPEEYKTTLIQLTDENVLLSGTSTSGAFILLPREGVDRWGEVQTFIKDKISF